MIDKSLNEMLADSFSANWDRPALSNFGEKDLTYCDVAQMIAWLHFFFEECGVRKGDNISICSKNQVNWAITFLATVTYGAIAVPILHEFKPANVSHLVRHSDSRLFFVSDTIWDSMPNIELCSELNAVVSLSDFNFIEVRNPVVEGAKERADKAFQAKYPDGIRKDELNYYKDRPSDLALINYTSGTSGFSKGVMLPFRSLVSNVLFAAMAEPHMDCNSKMVSMLPTAHMYGLVFEFLFEMTIGAHVYFLQRRPSPRVILSAMAEIRPAAIVAVPMIIEKIYKKQLQPYISKGHIKMLLNLPMTDQMIRKKICQSLVDSFGGNFKEVIIGGAAFNKEAESFFRKVGFPFTIGYGMTECGPIITYSSWNETKLYSCGKAAPGMEIMINSTDSENIPGEIYVRGDNLFTGYYKNDEATDEAFTASGWFKTGDIGVVDSEGFLFIKGRNKSMILGPSGQNIYPEEIESIINNMPYVVESLVIEDDGKLVGLVFPDLDQVAQEGLSKAQLEEKMKEILLLTNSELPHYCKLTSIELFPEEFEKTPKRSIKRYLYQRN